MQLRPRHVTLSVLAVLAGVAGAIAVTDAPPASSSNTYTVSERVQVIASGELGSVAAVPDADHIVVALDGSRAAVLSFTSGDIAPAPTSTSASTTSTGPTTTTTTATTTATTTTTSTMPTPAPAPFPTRTASSLTDFDQVSSTDGTLTQNSAVFVATYNGGGVNGYARGIFNFDSPEILEGQDTWSSASFYLPVGTLASAGYVSLLRRDNWPLYGSNGNTCGVAIYAGDDRLHVECDTYNGSWSAHLIDGIPVQEGVWFHVELHQRISTTAGALTELYINGVKVGSSTAANNLASRPTDRVRFGIVAVSPQNKAFAIWFKDAYVGATRQG